MGIQPIDLQTMYSQLSNVSKTMHGAQQAQLTEAMQQQNNIQKNLENAKKVQQTSNERANANSVNQNGSNSSFAGKQQQKKKEENEDEKSPYRDTGTGYKSPYCGTIIDITR